MFDLVDFYTLASELYQSCKVDKEEHIYRTIVGRAYYAAFLAARETCMMSCSGQSVHMQVVMEWKSRKPLIGNKLNELRDLRVNADYKLDEHIHKREAGIALRLAKDILVHTGKLS